MLIKIQNVQENHSSAISKIILAHLKPLIDGKLVKDCLLATVEILFPDEKKRLLYKISLNRTAIFCHVEVYQLILKIL